MAGEFCKRCMTCKSQVTDAQEHLRLLARRATNPRNANRLTFYKERIGEQKRTLAEAKHMYDQHLELEHGG